MACRTRSAPHSRKGPPDAVRISRASPIVPPGDALQHRAVLGVDRDDLAAAGAGGLGHQVPRHHQCLLVGQRYPLAGPERGQAWLRVRQHPPPRSPRCRHRDGLPLRPAPRDRSATALLAQPGQRRRRPAATRPPAPPTRSRFRPAVMATSRKCSLLPPENVQRAPPDGTGGAEQRDAPLRSGCRHSDHSERSGTERQRWESRSRASRTGPAPLHAPESGALESLTPASRLNSDSARSPTCPTTDRTPAMTSSCPSRQLGHRRGETLRAQRRSHHEAAHHTRDAAGPGFSRAHGRGQLGPAESPAAEHRGGIADPGDDQGEEHQPGAGPGSLRDSWRAGSR